jgi:hypothetical protein
MDDIKIISHDYSSIVLYVWVILFQISVMKSSRKALTLYYLYHIRIFSDHLNNLV